MDTIFTESQKFTQWWLWAILLSVLGFLLYGFIRQLVFKKSFGNNPMPNWLFLILLLFEGALITVLATTQLETTVDQQEIRVRFFPFQSSWTVIPTTDIEHFVLKEYEGISYGIRYDFKNKIKYYNVRSGTVLHLTLKDGEHIAFGTQREKELEEYLRRHFPTLLQ